MRNARAGARARHFHTRARRLILARGERHAMAFPERIAGARLLTLLAMALMHASALGRTVAASALPATDIIHTGALQQAAHDIVRRRLHAPPRARTSPRTCLEIAMSIGRPMNVSTLLLSSLWRLICLRSPAGYAQ